MAKHSAALRLALATAGAALALATASPALAAPGDFTVSGPASFPAPVAVGQSATQTYAVTNHTASPWVFGGIGLPARRPLRLLLVRRAVHHVPVERQVRRDRRRRDLHHRRGVRPQL